MSFIFRYIFIHNVKSSQDHITFIIKIFLLSFKIRNLITITYSTQEIFYKILILLKNYIKIKDLRHYSTTSFSKHVESWEMLNATGRKFYLGPSKPCTVISNLIVWN